MDTLQRAALFCLVVGSVESGQATGQRLDLVRPALPLTDQTALICEAGDLLGAGGHTKNATTSLIPVVRLNRQKFLIELVTRVDRDHDRKLDHSELQSLDRLTRQQLLRELDANYDRKLSFEELEQEITPKETAPNETPSYPEKPTTTAPPKPETYRNLRRFGIGLEQVQPTPRSQPFARAATFGTTSNFTRPVTKNAINRRSGGRCRSGGNTQASIYLRVGSR